MKREDILRRVGHMSQVAEVRKISFGEGRAAGMKDGRSRMVPWSLL